MKKKHPHQKDRDPSDELEMPLSRLELNQGGVIIRFETPAQVTQKLMEMGLAPGEFVRFIRRAPFGDPIEIELLNYRLAIRKSEARKIFLRSPIQI